MFAICDTNTAHICSRLKVIIIRNKVIEIFVI